MKPAASMTPVLLLALVGFSAAALEAEERPRLPESSRVSAGATRVVFSLQTGSCWGQSTEKRTVEIRGARVVIKSTDGEKRLAERSLAWWEATRVILNLGLAASTQKPKNGDCYLPNWICGFEIEQVVDGKKSTLSGCCNGSKEASRVQDAFRRLKPGGPLGPDRPPAP